MGMLFLTINLYFYKKKLTMNKMKYVLLPLLFFNILIQGQNNHADDMQYGVSIRATIDLTPFDKQKFKNSSVNISLTGGLGFHPFEISSLYQSFHLGILMYSRGDLGAPYNKGFFEGSQFELIGDATLTGGYFAKNANHTLRRVPLYHFSQITSNPLVNPFQHSFSLGTVFVKFFDSYKDSFQQVGFGNVMIDRRFQLNMFNDGTPFSIFQILNDKQDRYYTGGGMLSWHNDSTYEFDLIEFSFLKFTGYEEGLFELANLLQVDVLAFKNENTIYYNKNRLRFRIMSSRNNYSAHITFHNTDIDFQDFIHLKGDWTFFPDIFKNQKGWDNELRRMGIGGSYFHFKNYR